MYRKRADETQIYRSAKVRAEVEREIAALTGVDLEQNREVRRAILIRTMRKVNEGGVKSERRCDAVLRQAQQEATT